VGHQVALEIGAPRAGLDPLLSDHFGVPANIDKLTLYGKYAMNSKTRISEEALEQRARRVARRSGLVALKSRWRSPENLGGFMIVDPKRNYAVAGSRYNLSAEGVIDYCSDDE
jgi:hypothetical protein